MVEILMDIWTAIVQLVKIFKEYFYWVLLSTAISVSYFIRYTELLNRLMSDVITAEVRYIEILLWSLVLVLGCVIGTKKIYYFIKK